MFQSVEYVYWYIQNCIQFGASLYHSALVRTVEQWNGDHTCNVCNCMHLHCFLATGWQELVLSVCETFMSVTKVLLPYCSVTCYNKHASFCLLLLIPTLENNAYYQQFSCLQHFSIKHHKIYLQSSSYQIIVQWNRLILLEGPDLPSMLFTVSVTKEKLSTKLFIKLKHHNYSYVWF
jgi:hypothetical protein